MIIKFIVLFIIVYRETVLVTAAAGAIGLAAVDLAANVFNCKVSKDPKLHD